ncbi:recombinase family protein, partial [Candidatus Woesearchaeota archaeon]
MYIGYVRVSRSEENPENQVQAIRRFVGEDKEVKIFMDVGVSGVIPAKKRKG